MLSVLMSKAISTRLPFGLSNVVLIKKGSVLVDRAFFFTHLSDFIYIYIKEHLPFSENIYKKYTDRLRPNGLCM